MNRRITPRFYITKICGIAVKTRRSVKYLDIPSVIRPVPHSLDLPIPVPPETWNVPEDEVVINIEPCADLSSDEERGNPD